MRMSSPLPTLLCIGLLLWACSKENFLSSYPEIDEEVFPYPNLRLELNRTAFDAATAELRLENFKGLPVRVIGRCIGIGVVPEVGGERCVIVADGGADTLLAFAIAFPEIDSNYLVRAYAELTDGRILYSNTASFLTPGFVLTTSGFARLSSEAGENTAVIEGFFERLAPDIPIDRHGHAWSTREDIETLADGDTTDLGPYVGNEPFTSRLSGLIDGETYYARAYAQVADRTYFGNTSVFTVGGWGILPATSPLPPPRILATGFAIGDKLYVVGGFFFDGDPRELFDLDLTGDVQIASQLLDRIEWREDFWEYDLAAGVWTRKTPPPIGRRAGGLGFAVDGMGYSGMGWRFDGASFQQATPNDLYRYDPTTDTWTSVAVPADVRGRVGGLALQIDGDIFLGMGATTDGEFTYGLSDFYRFTPETETWDRRRDFGGGTRVFAAGFATNGRGYVGLGDTTAESSIFLNFQPGSDFWSYDPDGDQWTRKEDFPGGDRSFSKGFASGDRGHVYSGWHAPDLYYDDQWAYDTERDLWVEQTAATSTIGARGMSTLFTGADRSYLGFGFKENGPGDLIWPTDWWTHYPRN